MGAPTFPVDLSRFDRYWLLTSTSYGTWLPGDERGFVSPIETGIGPQIRHNVPGTEYDADIPGYARSASRLLKCPPIFFNVAQATAMMSQFHETTAHRGWRLCAAAILVNHFHIVVGVPGDPEPETLLRDYKSYASRRLNEIWPRPASNTWWTESGSKRKLPDANAVIAAVDYVRNQHAPLVVYIAPEFTLPGERGASAP
jgi:REP element-mobilizing transposase RayT